MLKGIILEIMPIKYSRTDGQYSRVKIRLETGEIAFTDLVSNYRNYQNWKYLLKVGNKISGLQLMPTKGKVLKVNADSMPRLVSEKVSGHWEQNKKTGNMMWVNDYEILEDQKLKEINLKQNKLKL